MSLTIGTEIFLRDHIGDFHVECNQNCATVNFSYRSGVIRKFVQENADDAEEMLFLLLGGEISEVHLTPAEDLNETKT